ncbi:NEW3 domain-containing protein [Chloroflexota bacterium]
MKYISIVTLFFILMAVLITALSPRPILAQEETIELKATYPRLESAAHEAIFKFSVSLIYRGGQAREFDLRTSGPSGWSTYVTSSDGSARVSVIKLEPNKSDPYQVKVIASPLPSTSVKVKDYTITLVASSGTISDSIELTAVVMPEYSLDLVASHRYNNEVTANRDNQFSLTVKNTGNGELTNISFSADKPQEWIVEFKPETIDRLAPGISQELQVNIKPSANTTDRDRYYDVTLTAEADQTRQTTTMNIRVEEPKLPWMWIGGAIALLAVGVFTFVFLRFSRNN